MISKSLKIARRIVRARKVPTMFGCWQVEVAEQVLITFGDRKPAMDMRKRLIEAFAEEFRKEGVA